MDYQSRTFNPPDERTPNDSFFVIPTSQSPLYEYNHPSRSVEEANHTISHHMEYSERYHSSFSYMQSSYFSQDVQSDWDGEIMHSERIYASNNDIRCDNYTDHNQYCEFHSIPHEQEQNGDQNISFEEMQGNGCHTTHHLFDQNGNTSTIIS